MTCSAPMTTPELLPKRSWSWLPYAALLAVAIVMGAFAFGEPPFAALAFIPLIAAIGQLRRGKS